MHDAGALWLIAAAACALVGMGWLALAMPVHALQVLGQVPAAAARRALRLMGTAALAIALACCLASDHASMAVLVWVMLLAAAAVATAVLLASRPPWLRLLAPWLKAPAPGRATS